MVAGGGFFGDEAIDDVAYVGMPAHQVLGELAERLGGYPAP